MRLENIPFRLESELVRRWNRLLVRRPSSAPYLSGDGFRALTPWRYEGEARQEFDPRLVPPGSLVFCEVWHLEEFLKIVCPQLGGPVVVVCSNGDLTFTTEKLGLIPSQVVRLWVQNCEVGDERVKPLPIGLENACLHVNGIVKDFEKLRTSRPELNRILWGFAEVTNPLIRGKAREALQRCPVADPVSAPNSRAYRKIAARYRFLASPPGNGPDCHRTWEALYLRTVPIVLRSVLTERLAALGLPLWLVDSYAELETVSEDSLERKYSEFSPVWNHGALWMDYWKKAIFEDL